MSRTALHIMRQALALAARGGRRVAPNPRVGAVVVRDGRVVGRGYHQRFGGPHAEVLALRQAGARARGAMLYVTLEPCAHHGKTPPCTDAILRAGIREVVCAMRDPHPLVDGRGIRRLRRAGVRVRVGVGVLATEAAHLNAAFVAAARRGRPTVTLKMAQTLDGKIATVTRQARWITGAPARRMVHQLRRATDAVLVGIGTVLADDPRLSVRADGQPSPRDPWRVVVDDTLRVPLTARVVRAARRCRVLVATTARSPRARRVALARRGVEVLVVPARRGRVSLRHVCAALVRRGVQRLLIEGGGEVAASALSERLVDRCVWFIAPKIVGGRTAPTPVGGPGIPRLDRAITLRGVTVRRLGADVLVTGDVVYA